MHYSCNRSVSKETVVNEDGDKQVLQLTLEIKITEEWWS